VSTDLEVARYFDPPLTTVPLRKRELGHIEAQKLIKVIAGDSETPVTVLAPELVVRSSTAPPRPACAPSRSVSPRVSLDISPAR